MTDIIKKDVLDFRKTKFVTSAPDISKLPKDLGAEIAIIGRSNSGKSSSINAICDQKTLAKTSRTPGRTRLINLFNITDKKYLVDLPGYGYAQVPENMKRQWQRAMTDYLQERKCLIVQRVHYFMEKICLLKSFILCADQLQCCLVKTIGYSRFRKKRQVYRLMLQNILVS
mgnify:CR=1 FL=1